MRALCPRLATKAIQLISKRHDNDCAIAALASYLGRDYGTVETVATLVNSRFRAIGLCAREHRKVAQYLGISTRWTPTFDINTDIGVLWLSFCTPLEQQHSVLLVRGWIFDPDFAPALVDHRDYCELRGAIPQQLLVKEGV